MPNFFMRFGMALISVILVITPTGNPTGFLSPRNQSEQGSSYQNPDNLLSNGDFENGVSPWEGMGDANLSPDAAHSGSTGVKITSETEAQQGWIPVTPGQTYHLKVWFRWLSFSGSNWGYDRVRVVEYNWGELAVSNLLHDQIPANEWTEIELTFTPQTNFVRIQMGLFGPQNGVELHFDDARLTTDQPTGGDEQDADNTNLQQTVTQNLLNNPDFEDGKASWQNLTDANLVTGDTASGVTASGSRAVRITSDLQASQGWIRVTPGSQYELRVWFKWNDYAGSRWGYDRIRVFNYDWSEALTVNQMHVQYAKGQWHELKYKFTPKTDQVSVSFGQFGPQDRVDLYFDSLSLSPVDPAAPVNEPTATNTTQPPADVTPTLTNTPIFTPTVTSTPTSTSTATQPVVSAPVENNLLPNADFESGVEAWSGIAAANIITSGTQSGGKAVRFTYAQEAQSAWLPVVAGQTYTLTAWFKWNEFSGANWGYDRLRVVNYDWSEAAVLNQLHIRQTRGVWQQVSLTFKPKTSQIRVMFGQFGPQDKVDIVFDNLAMVGASTGGQQPTQTLIPTLTPTPTTTALAPTPTVPTSTPPPAGSLITLPTVRTVNMPYLSGNILRDRYAEMSIFWLGRISNSDNYTDVRIAYNDTGIVIKANIFDKFFRYDTAGNAATLMQNDAISVFINTGNQGVSSPDSQTYRFTGGLNWWEDHSKYRSAARGNSGAWQTTSLAFTTLQGYAGSEFNNGKENRGWAMTFEIPYASLGLSGKPAEGTQWGIGVAVHDRDGASPNADRVYPESFSAANPSSWARLNFGLPAYTAPAAANTTLTTIRNKLNGVTVMDAGVGGDIGNLCNPSNIWDGWGNLNFKGQKNVNIQNQDYVGDWPCFSRFYVNFPLNSIPAGKVIVSAKLVMYQWGGSDMTQAKPSLIQIFSVRETWDENSITWNNSPLALENVSRTWVNPLNHTIQPNEWPGFKSEWDVTRAVAQAYGSGKPFNIVLYEADSAFHSGKYFSTSEADDWNATARPTLLITWGDPR